MREIHNRASFINGLSVLFIITTDNLLNKKLNFHNENTLSGKFTQLHHEGNLDTVVALAGTLLSVCLVTGVSIVISNT